jgi:hypothetical protein
VIRGMLRRGRFANHLFTVAAGLRAFVDSPCYSANSSIAPRSGRRGFEGRANERQSGNCSWKAKLLLALESVSAGSQPAVN